MAKIIGEFLPTFVICLGIGLAVYFVFNRRR